MTIDTNTKRAALKLLRKGLITRAEAAKLAGISRQLARVWEMEVEPGAREKYITALWNKTMGSK